MALGLKCGPEKKRSIHHTELGQKRQLKLKQWGIYDQDITGNIA